MIEAPRILNSSNLTDTAGDVSFIRQSVQAETEEQHLLLLLPVQLWEVSYECSWSKAPI